MQRPLNLWLLSALVLTLAVAGCSRGAAPVPAKAGEPAAGATPGENTAAATPVPATPVPATPVPATPAPATPAPATPAPATPAPATPGAGPSATAGLVPARQQLDRSGGVRPAQKSLVYFIDRAATAPTLQPVEVLIAPTKGVARAALTQLIQGAEHEKLDGGIPAGTRILGIGAANGVLTVNLSKEFYPSQQTAAWAREVTAALVRTLTVFSTVQWVTLLIEGQPAVLAGSPWSVVKAQQDALELRIEPVIRYQGS